MRVLKVVDALRFGGAESLIVQLVRVSAETDLEVSVVALQGHRPEHVEMSAVLQDAGVKPKFLETRRTLDMRAFLRLVELIKDTKPDVVHAHLEMAVTMALPAAALAGVPAVATFHHLQGTEGRASAEPALLRLGTRALWRERLALEVATRSQAAIFVSQASLESFTGRYRAGKPIPASWKVLHNGADLDHFTPMDGIGAATNLPPDLRLGSARVVTVAAGLRDDKGIIHAVEAWPGVVARFTDAKLLLAGSGPEEPSLRSRVSELGLDDSVVFAGLRNDVAQILQASEVVLLPSLFGENLPTVLIEAGGCGRPVVASDVGGVKDIVVDGETGLLIPPGDPGAIEHALTTLLGDPALGSELGAAGRRRMERLFDARQWARSLRTVYEEAVTGFHGSRRAQ